jgi:hypothetical protein
MQAFSLHYIKECGLVELFLLSSLNSTLKRDEWPLSRPNRFTAGKESPVPIKIRGWMGPKESPDVLEERNDTAATRHSSIP